MTFDRRPRTPASALFHATTAEAVREVNRQADVALDGVTGAFQHVPTVTPAKGTDPVNRPTRLTDRPQRLLGRRLRSGLLAASLTVVGLTGLGAASASAATSCDLDVCVVIPDTVATPVGVVTITVSDTRVVTVQLAPVTPNTLVLGIPFALPSGPPTLPGYSRTSIQTGGGEVDIDAVLSPPGPPNRFALPNVAIISIHPPNPCRVSTRGTLVTFTPIRAVGATG
jgi:hypothetical protein